jgi:enoyl-CoA hydratase/carnithine racemase
VTANVHTKLKRPLTSDIVDVMPDRSLATNAARHVSWPPRRQLQLVEHLGSLASKFSRGMVMAVVETERHGQILVVRMNRPERLNALSQEMRTSLAETWTEFRRSDDLEIAIFTGTGRGFCAGEDMKESLQKGAPGGQRPAIEDPFMSGTLEKPVIAAVNGFAMGGGFMLVERTDLRVAVHEAVFEVSEAKRWLLGGYNHGHIANLPYPIAMEMALGFRFTAQRFYEVGFLNRLVSAEQLMPTALSMAEHLLTLPPAARVNTVHMMRQMRPAAAPEMNRLAAALHEHGAKSDLMESRAAFAEKRKPRFKGWNDPQDRYRLPTLESLDSAK